MADRKALPSLPLEVQSLIIMQVVDHFTLKSLLSTSRALKIEAERSLYHTVSLNALFKRVYRCQRLAPLVICILNKNAIETWPAAAKAIARILPFTVNLKSLEWMDDGKCPDPSAFTDVHRPLQLLELYWDDWDPKISRVFPNFLMQQQRLDRLLAYGRDQWTPLALSPAACPRLSELETNLEDVSMFFRGRTIKYLYWLPDTYPVEQHHIMRTLTTLKSLKLHTHEQDVLPHLAPYLRGLEYLYVAGNHLRPAELRPLESLRGLTYVSTLKANGEEEPYVPVHTPDVFAVVPTLRFVELREMDDRPVQRWDRGAAAPYMLPGSHNWRTSIA